jgi:CYTH domain-containing protein
MEVYDEHGNVKNDVNYVLNTWSKEYEILYQGYNVDEFNSTFYSFALEEIERMESEEHNDMDMWYNKDIKEDEVKFVLKKARLKKAVGIDNIPYDVLKNSFYFT